MAPSTTLMPIGSRRPSAIFVRVTSAGLVAVLTPVSFHTSPAAVTLLGSPSSSPQVSTSRSSPIHSRPVTFGSKPAGRRLTRS